MSCLGYLASSSKSAKNSLSRKKSKMLKKKVFMIFTNTFHLNIEILSEDKNVFFTK